MTTSTHEIADRIYRISTVVPDAAPGGFTFNQFLVDADQPLLFHTGPRRMFPVVSEAVGRIVPLDRLRWITFGHVESDECGAMNQFLAAAPRAEVAHGAIGCMVSLEDLCDRPPRKLDDGEVLDLGGKRVRHLDTPHVPHNWEARVLFEETTRTLFCGDLFTHLGDGPALTEGDIVGPALAAEDVFHATALSAATGPTIRRLATLEPRTLAIMHGSSTRTRSVESLVSLADAYDARVAPG
jgi:flavorubredoxin